MDEDKERINKSEKLFDKGMECYNNQQYKEALKYFEACIKFHKNDRAELFIRVCKNNIPEEDNKKMIIKPIIILIIVIQIIIINHILIQIFHLLQIKLLIEKRNQVLQIIIFKIKVILQIILVIAMKIKFVKN